MFNYGERRGVNMKMNASVKRYLRLAVVLACIFCIAVISLFSGIGGLHECSDEFCVVCSVITLNEQIIRGLLTALCLICCALIICSRTEFLRISEIFRITAQTPVCLKVKLSD